MNRNFNPDLKPKIHERPNSIVEELLSIILCVPQILVSKYQVTCIYIVGRNSYQSTVNYLKNILILAHTIHYFIIYF